MTAFEDDDPLDIDSDDGLDDFDSDLDDGGEFDSDLEEEWDGDSDLDDFDSDLDHSEEWDDGGEDSETD